MLQRLLQYWRTLRYLKPVQLYGRLWFRLHQPKVDDRAAPAPRPASGPWRAPAGRPQSQFGPDTFRFLNHQHSLGGAQPWNDPRCGKLWLYNLHYFDDLNSSGASSRTAWHAQLIQRWIAENPPAAGNGWEPYPTSLRIVNWIKWAQAGNALAPAALNSLAVQVRWLSRRVEHHLLANHLFVNAKALLLAGMFFDAGEAAQWREQGLRILRRQIPEQVLADGGHFELTPMYHAIILEDILDLVNADARWPGLLTAPQSAALRGAAEKMLPWLGAMIHPDGDIAFFNDAALAIAPTFGELCDYAARLGLPVPAPGGRTSLHLRESGYLGAQRGDAVLLVDAARIGPDYQPGHAHADTLSFEFSLHGRRAFVNGGTSTYQTGPQRSAERGTAAHNTLVIDGRDSSEVWGGFRVARRARPFDVQCRDAADATIISAAHDGYRRLAGRPIHHRQWKLAANSLVITDRISGTFTSAAARFHLHPDLKIPEPGVIVMPGGQRLRYSARGGTVGVEAASWHPEFGKSVDSACLVLTLDAAESVFELQWK